MEWPDEAIPVKHSAMRSIAHNLADSLSSGIGLLIGHYDLDIYGEAGQSGSGAIVADFIAGRVLNGDTSPSLTKAIYLYGEALNYLAAAHGGSREDFKELTVRFWSDQSGITLPLQLGTREAAGQLSNMPAGRVSGSDRWMHWAGSGLCRRSRIILAPAPCKD